MGVSGGISAIGRYSYAAILYVPVLANQAIYCLPAGRGAPYILSSYKEKLPHLYL